MKDRSIRRLNRRVKRDRRVKKEQASLESIISSQNKDESVIDESGHFTLTAKKVIDSSASTEAFIFDGLIEAFETNLSLQEQTENKGFIVTEVINSLDNVVIQVVQTFNKVSPAISIHLPFVRKTKNKDFFSKLFNFGEPQERDAEIWFNDNIPMSKFLRIKEVELKKFSSSDDLKEFIIDFGIDTKYAALLTSKILIEAFEYDKNAVFKFETSDFGA
tara:strand:- start:287 stop:940 length:654 start_codon:yes stop_codon:yes gene_type:complete